MPECVLCGLKPVTFTNLAAHLMKRHAGKRCGDVTFRPCYVGYFQCWCGARVTGPHSFGVHLQNRGGLAAHLLEISLGLYPEGA